jgi:hypothetical protein
VNSKIQLAVLARPDCIEVFEGLYIFALDICTSDVNLIVCVI